MKIYLDYIGTVVETNGRCNFGCFEVIKKLQDAGHTIVLNTSNEGQELEKALDMINNKHWMFIIDRRNRNDFEIQPISHTKEKFRPNRWDLDEAIKHGEMYIDDYAYGIPTKPSGFTSSNLVDWNVLDTLFKEKGVY